MLQNSGIGQPVFYAWLRQSRASLYFAIAAFVICLAYYFLESINGRAQMADFRVYYDAANAFLFDTQLYGKAFGVSSGFYKYSPFATMPFIPLAVLPYGLASLIYYLIIALCIVWFSLRLYFFIVFESSEKPLLEKNTGWPLLCIAMFMADHLERELHLGNVNLFLLIGTFYVFKFSIKQKQTSAAFLLGLLLLFKPHFLILLPYFLWKKQWRTLIFTFIAVSIGLFIPALLKGISQNVILLEQWLAAMQDHNVHLYDSPNTIYGIVNHFLLQNHGSSWLVLLLLVLTASLFIWLMLRNKTGKASGPILFIEFFVLIALIPNLAHTDTEHFMWTWPLIAYIIIQLFRIPLKSKWMYIALVVLAFIPYCLNSPDLVGRELRFLFDEGGLLGAANLLLIVVAVILHSKNETQPDVVRL